MSISKDSWNIVKKSLVKKNDAHDPLMWLTWSPLPYKNWYHLRLKSCHLGALRQPEHIVFILNRVTKSLWRAEDE